MSEENGNEDLSLPEDGDDALKIAELNIEATTILISLHNLKVAIKNIEGNVRHYQKETVRLLRTFKKNQRTKNVKKGGDVAKKEREPSGFAKKTKIRPVFLEFLKRPDVMSMTDMIMNEEDMKGDSKFEPLDEENMINRPSATKIINRYIKEKKLQVPTARKHFMPDEVLKRILLPLEKKDKEKQLGAYKFFNLQKYIKHLFIPA